MNNSVDILAISGSPRVTGNSKSLLEEFLRGAGEKGIKGDLIIINKLNFRPCQACGACSRDGVCVLRDDMQEVHKLASQARGIVVAAPIHFGSMSSQTKMMIDRFQAFWAAKHVLEKPRIGEEEGKIGFFICVEGSPVKKFCHNAYDIIKVFYDILNVQDRGMLCYSEVRSAPPGIRDNPQAMEQVYQAGMEFAEEIIKRK
ncbi:flavodoxin family protein [Candidatus Contubernalis alkaliaceticus]|uniref:flavodoxin family protein n=1 Tax=Candidatus Contubernalis alkaliaceticus TaxID=338645 RepID=UPI001F4C3211|nr:flavodoxin family protein [Candidatus Contubernalis alkalaceticus]UNC91857.1 flavodoxin family protein [Candidatus Contubernalis alkalaceticus]